MEKFTNIMEEIRATYAAIEDAETAETAAVDRYMCFNDPRERYAAKKAEDDDLKKISERKLDLKIKMQILKNNARVALFHEALPVALEILAKYQGKPYGEKTRQKISDAVQEKTACRFYISSRYGSDCMNFYPVNALGNEYAITCGTEISNGSRQPILVDNKIQPVKVEDVGLYYISDDYVEDIPRRIQDVKAAYAEAYAKQKELEEICSRYRNLAVGDLPQIYADKHIYPSIPV